MCELLGMSANVPTDICFSFSGLMQRGGNTGPHIDGWGITFYEGKGYRCFKEHIPIVDSEIAQLLQRHPIKSKSIISHIRQANRGAVNLENTHPFTRELWGEYWTFAHNGQLSDYADLDTGTRYTPVGDTDSEYVFCWLLNQMFTHFPAKPDDMTPVFELIIQCCEHLKSLGVFNTLLTDGHYLISYCTNHLYWITRKTPFGEATLIDDAITIDFQEKTTTNDVVSVIATQPLTENETWQRMKPGEYGVFSDGQLIHSNADKLSAIDYAPILIPITKSACP